MFQEITFQSFFLAVEQLALNCPDLYELDLSGSDRIRNRSLDILEEYLGDSEVMVITVGGTDLWYSACSVVVMMIWW